MRLDRLIVRSILQHRRENIELIGSSGLVLTISDVLEREATLCLLANGSMVGSGFCVMSVEMFVLKS